ncbi:MAG: hypothetical protein ABI382_09405 [Nakamurella sp.]
MPDVPKSDALGTFSQSDPCCGAVAIVLFGATVVADRVPLPGRLSGRRRGPGLR